MAEDFLRDTGGQSQEAVITECLLFSDKQGVPNSYPYLSSPPVYERHTTDVLGEDRWSLDEGVDHCFNCGSTHHHVSSCTVPYNTELIALSRQMYYFFKSSRPAEQMTISAAAEFKHRRRQWIDSFEPGSVRGSLLREALGLRDEDAGSDVPWLKNMADWGYPNGWFSERDPREQILLQIDSLFVESLNLREGDHYVAIFGDDRVEILDIGALPPFDSPHREGTDEQQDSRSRLVTQPDRAEQAELGRGRRWATYPSTYFSTGLLPLYDGTRLPPVLPTTSSTFTSERHLLWERILHDANCTPVRVLVSQDTGNVPQKVKPSSPPPPIAPPPPLPSMPLPASGADSGADDARLGVYQLPDPSKDRESDMEVSDSDS